MTLQRRITKRSRSQTRKRSKRSWWLSRTNISTSPSRWSRTSHERGILSWLKFIVDQAGAARRQRKCASNGIFTENVLTTVTGKRVMYQRRISLPQKWRRFAHSWQNAAVNRGSGWDLAVLDHPKNHLTSTLYLSSYNSVKIHDQIMLASRGTHFAPNWATMQISITSGHPSMFTTTWFPTNIWSSSIFELYYG